MIAGGPGTGKTRTIARLLGAAHGEAFARGRQLDVALAAPTGKAAERMTAAVQDEAEEASLREGVADALRVTVARTLHRLLGARAGESLDTTISTRCPTISSSSTRRRWSPFR